MSIKPIFGICEKRILEKKGNFRNILQCEMKRQEIQTDYIVLKSFQDKNFKWKSLSLKFFFSFVVAWFISGA